VTHYADPSARNSDEPRCHYCGRRWSETQLDPDPDRPRNVERYVCEECAEERELERADTLPPGEVL